MPLLAALSQTRPAHIARRSPALPFRQALPLVCQHQVALLGLLLVIGLAGCGPASSDNPSNLGNRASVGAQLPQKSPSPGNGPAVPVGNPVVPVNGTSPEKLSFPTAMPNVEANGRDTFSPPGIPESVIKGLESPNARERLQAMNYWDTKGATAPLDPLFAA